VKGWDDTPEPRTPPILGPQTGSYTRDWADAMDEAREMRAAVVAAQQEAAGEREQAAPRHRRRHRFPWMVVRAAAACLVAAGTLLVAAGTALAGIVS
jgi:hypothetical protein